MILISCIASILIFVSKIKAVSYFDGDENASSEETSTLLQSFVRQPQQHCTSTSARSLLFVSTADGKFTCMNAHTGNLVWSIPSTQSLITSSISTIKSITELTEARLIPSLSGNLYKWTGENLETVPLSADYLLSQIKKLPDGNLVAGGQEVTIQGVDINSGEISFKCSLTGCQPVDDDEGEEIKDKDILSLRRTQKTIRIIERRTGKERWNFSVGNFEIELLEAENNKIQLDCEQDSNIMEINFVMQDGIVTNNVGDAPWSFQFNSPIVAAWKLDDNTLKVMNTFSHKIFDFGDVDIHSFMYLGIYNGQMYVQQPPRKQHEEINTFSTEVDKNRPQFGQWRPFLNNEKSSNALESSLDYPFDNGFFLYTNTTGLALPITDWKDANDVCSTTNPDVCEIEAEEEISSYDYVPLGILDWWKEIFVLSILLAVGFNVVIRVLKRKLGLAQLQAETRIVEAEEAKEELPQEVSTRRIKGNSISIATGTTAEGFDGATSSTSTLTSTSVQEYISRYIVDFHHLECLGKGGFGVVFKAKKKIDDFEYAIKRIYLPRCDEAKARMMREVRALAALEHPGIVRYFHAWWEEPPEGWQEETDRHVLMKDLDEAPSYALSDDWVVELDISEQQQKRQQQRKKRKTNESENFDLFGKRFNIATSTEDLSITDNYLLRHNDVFFSDESTDALSRSSDSFIAFTNSSDGTRLDNTNCDEDSFHMIEKNNTESGCSDFSEDSSINFEKTNEVGCCLIDSDYTNTGSHQRVNTLTENNEEESFIVFEHEKDDEEPPDEDFSQEQTNFCAENKRKSNRRVVGKCCNRSSVCLKQPPLFLYIQMQLCRPQTLKDWLIERSSEICFPTSFNIFMQIVNAVEYFHSQGMMHRDLKPANIFFSMDGSIKVGDFGLVTAITRPSRGKRKTDFHHDENHTGQVGTQLYMSPEQVGGKPYSQKVDLYAVGLILLELLCHFSTQMERMQLIYDLRSGNLPPNLLDTPQGKLVNLLTSEEPSNRPEAKEIKTHSLTEEMRTMFQMDTK